MVYIKDRIESLSGSDGLKISEIKKDNRVVGTRIVFKIPLEMEF